MENWLDSTPHRAASHLNMIDHLSGPLTAGASVTPCTIKADGQIVIDWSGREPLLLIAPNTTLETETLHVTAVLDPNGAKTALKGLEFAPYTEALSFLPLYRPPVSNIARTADKYTLALTLTRISVDGATKTIAPNQIAQMLTAHIVEGVMGRMLYLLGAEKSRQRRMAREIAAARKIDTAHDHALDLIGADLGVPRFADTLAFKNYALVTETQREDDSDYRRRLHLYRPWSQGTLNNILGWLNGPSDEINKGLLSQLGVQARFNVIETNNPFAIAIHIVATSEGVRANFFDYLSKVYLVHVDAGGDAIHQARYVSDINRQQIEAFRQRLRTNFNLAAATALAPGLAAALDRVGRCLRALNTPKSLTILRAFDPNGGTRYELGLGADLRPLAGDDLNAIANAVRNKQWTLDDNEVVQLLSNLTPRSIAEDPDLAWLLNACGLRTVHRFNADHIYVSHFPTFGLIVAAPPSVVPAGQSQTLDAYYEARGLPGSNVVLEDGLRSALQAWVADGNEPLEELSREAAADRLTHVTNDAVIREIFDMIGLPDMPDAKAVAQRLNAQPPELFKVIRLNKNLADAVLARSVEASAKLRTLVQHLRDQHLVSLLPFVTDSKEILLAVGVIGLPEVGLNLSDRRSTGFRWYTTPISHAASKLVGSINPLGSHTTYTAGSADLTAIVVLGYARRGLTDPYEFRVELPDDALLTPLQYEYLMNMLERIYPMGVEINTYPIRQHHVDLNGDGNADPLLPTISRTYRRFVRPRQVGQESFTL